MIVQIYRQIPESITTDIVEEARELGSMGVDHIGLAPISNDLNLKKTKKIFNSLEEAKGSACTVSEGHLETIFKVVEQSNPNILHLAESREQITLAKTKKIRRNYPDLEIMRAIYIQGKEDIDLAKKYSEVVDYLLLDTKEEEQLGITGKTHDWSISRQIVDSVDIPVILAGGLSPENVEKAIKKVEPAGVDSNTQTNKPDSWKKDLEKCRRFTKRAKNHSK